MNESIDRNFICYLHCMELDMIHKYCDESRFNMTIMSIGEDYAFRSMMLFYNVRALLNA